MSKYFSTLVEACPYIYICYYMLLYLSAFVHMEHTSLFTFPYLHPLRFLVACVPRLLSVLFLTLPKFVWLSVGLRLVL